MFNVLPVKVDKSVENFSNTRLRASRQDYELTTTEMIPQLNSWFSLEIFSVFMIYSYSYVFNNR